MIEWGGKVEARGNKTEESVLRRREEQHLEVMT
jgi:hypothetical protein